MSDITWSFAEVFLVGLLAVGLMWVINVAPGI